MSKIKIDFEVRSDLKWIKVTDMSNWGTIANSPSIIEITRPGFTRFTTKYFDKNKTNIFNSLMLDSNCTDCANDELIVLEDGIWLITVKGSPSTFNKEIKYLKTDSIQMEIDKIYIDSFENKDKSLVMNKLVEIEFLLKSAESFLRYDMERECRMAFEQAQHLVEDLTKCKSC
jgi:hypothetical protein